MRKTKIIATYGPSIDNDATLANLVKKVNVFRLNLSHGNEESWLLYKDRIERIAAREKRSIAVLADLPGPKIRIAKIPTPIGIKMGEEVCIAHGNKDSTGFIPTDYRDLYKDAKVGAYIIIGDGIIKMRIQRISGQKIYCKALNSGIISSGKGISLQGASISSHVPTSQDLELAKFAKKNNFDYIALSFVRVAQSLTETRRAIGDAFLISKIEREEALRNIDDIVEASDGIMIARGDLALDIPIQHIPTAQRLIVEATRAQGKPVIVATQMLASMTKSPMPTRAEVTDISNGVMEGADCLMLSEETAAGDYPINAVDVMVDTINETEKYVANKAEKPAKKDPNYRIAFAAADIANEYNVDRIFTPTLKGITTMRLSALRPHAEIIALCDSKSVGRRLSMYYGVSARYVKRYRTIDNMFSMVHKVAKDERIKRYLVVFGTPNKAGSTDTIRYVEK